MAGHIKQYIENYFECYDDEYTIFFGKIVPSNEDANVIDYSKQLKGCKFMTYDKLLKEFNFHYDGHFWKQKIKNPSSDVVKMMLLRVSDY